MLFLSWPIDGKTIAVCLLMITIYFTMIWSDQRKK